VGLARLQLPVVAAALVRQHLKATLAACRPRRHSSRTRHHLLLPTLLPLALAQRLLPQS
jgi:hypothetical protein